MVWKEGRCDIDPSGSRVIVEEQHGQLLDYVGECLKNMYVMLI